MTPPYEIEPEPPRGGADSFCLAFGSSSASTASGSAGSERTGFAVGMVGAGASTTTDKARFTATSLLSRQARAAEGYAEATASAAAALVTDML